MKTIWIYNWETWLTELLRCTSERRKMTQLRTEMKGGMSEEIGKYNESKQMVSTKQWWWQ